jgi:hypothetical protein
MYVKEHITLGTRYTCTWTSWRGRAVITCIIGVRLRDSAGANDEEATGKYMSNPWDKQHNI